MSARRSSRNRDRPAELAGYVHEGLRRLFKGNEAEVRSMLDAPKSEAVPELIDRCAGVMRCTQSPVLDSVSRSFSEAFAVHHANSDRSSQ